jgi:hypothetical protein
MRRWTLPLAALALAFWSVAALAHDVAEGDKAFVLATDGPAILPFLYLGAKHMVTGYDHILFLIGVVFYLYRLKDVILYVSMFTIGHSATLLLGVLLNFGANANLVDAVIGLSVAYKGMENIGGFRKLGISINSKMAVLAFGLVHGLGLATKLAELSMPSNGLLTNLISFNIGVEVGQCLVLAFVLMLLSLWRGTSSFQRWAFTANLALIAAGLFLTALQMMRYFES